MQALNMDQLPSFESYMLSPLDHVNLPMHVPLSFTFAPPDIAKGVSALERGISLVITQLPFLAGNVVLQKWDFGTVTSPTKDDLLACPIVRTKDHPQSIGHVNNMDYGVQESLPLEKFLPIPAARSISNPGPILRFQINAMSDGIILAMCVHHLAMDGLGIMNVLNAISSCCASLNSGKQLRLSTTPAAEAKMRRRVATLTTAGPFENLDSYSPYNWSNADLSGRAFFIPAKRVRQLRQFCNVVRNEQAVEGQAGAQTKEEKEKLTARLDNLSASDVVSALLWMCATRARSQSPISSTTFPAPNTRMSVAVNVRSIVKPPLPLSYLGNAMVVSSHTHPRHTISNINTNHSDQPTTSTRISKPQLSLLTTIASQIRHGIKTINDAHVRRVVSHINANDDPNATPYYQPDVFITNVRVLDLRTWDFGPDLGKVVGSDHLETRINGLCSIQPTTSLSGQNTTTQDLDEPPWKVRITLERDAMEQLERDPLFCWVLDAPGAKL